MQSSFRPKPHPPLFSGIIKHLLSIIQLSKLFGKLRIEVVVTATSVSTSTAEKK